MPHYTEAQKREILRQARASVAGHRPSTTSRTSSTPYTGTEAQKREILRKARALVAGHIPTTSRSSATSRTSTTSRQPHRTDQSRFGLVHKTYEPKDDDDQSTANGAVAVRAAAPVATASAAYEGPWWKWVEEHVDHRNDFVFEVVGEALGHSMRDLREPLEREDNAIRRELELVRRELAALREEVGLERGLRDLRDEVETARKQVPKVPAIAERLRAEASIARVDVGVEQAKLRRDLDATKRAVTVLRARHATLDHTVSELRSVQPSEVEFQSSTERVVIRSQIHPDAARALREFAAIVLDNDDVVH